MVFLSVFPAIHVMSTFVHNEPTSLAILQEAKLPEVFYDAIEESIEPSLEVCLPCSFLYSRFIQIISGNSSGHQRDWRFVP